MYRGQKIWVSIVLILLLGTSSCVSPQLWGPPCLSETDTAEEQFLLNKDKFIQLATETVEEYANSEQNFNLPPSPLYNNASVYSIKQSTDEKEIVIEFDLIGFYCPLVYIPSDNPDNVRDTCSYGGFVERKVSDKWYICERDLN